MTDNDFESMIDLEFVSAKQMVIICLSIEIVVQIFALAVQPTAWWTWQLLGFIAATNLGAVVLAIFAQRSADKIGAVYRRVFTSDFYETVAAMSDIRRTMVEQAENDDTDFDTDDIAPEIYQTVRDYFKTKQLHENTPTPDIDVPYVSPEEVSFINEEELFRDA
tara:strand:+ start:1361 stop:1852 length:492 start_codon:yes stop_codon:yes gene_type:complete